MNSPFRHRALVPELLDSLPADDPRAIRSRHDLRMIHFLMGNERWMLKHIAAIAKNSALTFFELGAGDASFCRKLLQHYPHAKIHAYDIQSRPDGLSQKIHWHKGDIRDATPPLVDEGSTCILLCSMFLHHFPDEELAPFRPWFHACDHALLVEPWRHRAVALLGACLHPFFNDVTRHDMRVSIQAGFCGNELAAKICPDPTYSSKTTQHWRGAHRVILHRRETH